MADRGCRGDGDEDCLGVTGGIIIIVDPENAVAQQPGASAVMAVVTIVLQVVNIEKEGGAGFNNYGCNCTVGGG